MKQLILFAIGLYRRFISPYKGFSCAYRVHTGRASCSEFGLRAIRVLGAWRGIPVLRMRLAKCGDVYHAHAALRPAVSRHAGFCDLSCDLPCDADCGSAAGDVLTNCASPCDGVWDRSNKKQERRRKASA